LRARSKRHSGVQTGSDVAHVFAYGTLLDPARVEALIGRISRWRYLGRGTVQGRLYNLGAYPAFTPGSDADEHVPGVVIEFDNGQQALARLDAYEDVGAGLYRRERCLVRLVGGDMMAAWVYVYCLSVSGLRRIRAWPVHFDD